MIHVHIVYALVGRKFTFKQPLDSTVQYHENK